MTSRTVIVSDDLAGMRVDKVIATALGLSRGVARSIIDAGAATVDDEPLGAATKLAQGTRIVVIVPDTDIPLSPDATVPFTVVYEDASLSVVDKPVGVVVHPGSGRAEGTLANGLLARYPEIEGVGERDRWGIVHRLDRDTSGLLVVGRTQAAHTALTEMLRNHEIERRYLTAVKGSFSNTTGTIDAPIGRDQGNRTRMSIAKGGRAAVTHYRRLAGWSLRDTSLLSVTLETGRTHQIRVHMRAIDRPIIGDNQYGRGGVIGDPGRPWLHARQLTFDHPLTGDRIDVLSPLPEDLSDSLEALGAPDLGETIDINGDQL